MHRDRVERAEQRNMVFYAKEVERIDHPRRSLSGSEYRTWDHQLESEIPRSDPECEEHGSARDVKRARGVSGEILIPSADETITAVPSGSIPSSSTSVTMSSWSIFNQWCEAYIQ